jgi:hypothetical protein
MPHRDLSRHSESILADLVRVAAAHEVPLSRTPDT